jgi:hypothetical protein
LESKLPLVPDSVIAASPLRKHRDEANQQGNSIGHGIGFCSWAGYFRQFTTRRDWHVSPCHCELHPTGVAAIGTAHHRFKPIEPFPPSPDATRPRIKRNIS